MSQSNQNNNNNNNNSGDEKDRKIFVGGLAWKSTSDDLKSFFQQFGEIEDANVVYETYPQGRSKGYGFVVFKEAKSAARVCEKESYVILGREANVNMAYKGVKDTTNQPNQNGHVNHQAPPLHQYQQPIYPTQWDQQYYYQPIYPTQQWAPQYYYYPQFNYQGLHYQYYPTPPMINYHYGEINVTQHNWSHQTNNHHYRPVVMARPNSSRPDRVTAPPERSSKARNENIDEITTQREISEEVVDNDHHDQETIEDGQEEDNNLEVHQEIEDGSQENEAGHEDTLE